MAKAEISDRFQKEFTHPVPGSRRLAGPYTGGKPMYLVQTNIDGYVEQLEFDNLVEAEAAAQDMANEGETCRIAQVLQEFKAGYAIPEAAGYDLADEYSFGEADETWFQ